MADEIEARVKKIVAERLDVQPEQVTLAASFTDDLKADSLSVMELVLEFEEAFAVQIPEEDMDKIKTVGDAVSYLRGKVA